jgi:hypothetical protein
MPGHRTRAAARLGGVTSRRHAELLLHSGVGAVSVKDLRLRRVVPPAAGSVGSSPECTAPVKSGSVESTPPEAASAAAAAEDLDRKPVSQRSFLDPTVPVPTCIASLVFRRLIVLVPLWVRSSRGPNSCATPARSVTGGCCLSSTRWLRMVTPSPTPTPRGFILFVWSGSRYLFLSRFLARPFVFVWFR